MTVHQNNCPRLLDRARDAHSLKPNNGLYPFKHFDYFLFRDLLVLFPDFFHTFAVFFIMLFADFLRSNLSLFTEKACKVVYLLTLTSKQVNYLFYVCIE